MKDRDIFKPEDYIMFDKDYIASLANIMHTMEFICTSENKYTTGGVTLTERGIFNFVD